VLFRSTLPFDALTTKLNKKLFGASETYYGGRKAPLTETEFGSLSKNQMEVLIKGIGEGKSTVRTSLLKTYQKRFGKEAFNEFLKTEAAEQRLSLTPERATVTKQTFGKTKLFGKSGSGVESIKIFSEPKLFSGLGSSLISTDFASSSITNAPVRPSIEKPVSYQIERVSYESDIVPVTRTGYITDTQQTVITDTSKAVTPKYKQKIDVIQYQPIIQLPEQKIIQETGQQLISEQGQEQQVIQEQQLRQDQLQRQDILTIQKQEQIPIQKQIQKQKQYQKTTGIFVPITPIYGGGDGGLGSGGGGGGRYKQRKYKEREYGIPFVWSVPKELEQKTETKQKAELKKKKNNEDEIDPFIRF
jgi:hypothetical protein